MGFNVKYFALMVEFTAGVVCIICLICIQIRLNVISSSNIENGRDGNVVDGENNPCVDQDRE